MELATTGLYRARWTSQIHQEWTRNVQQNRPDVSPAQLERTVDLMNRAVMDCLVSGYEDLIDGLDLPDRDDRHILAAAIRSRANAIVTFNLDDFPSRILSKYDVEAQHRDEFLHHQFGLDQAQIIMAAQKIRKRLKNPPKTAEEYLDILEAQRLPHFVAALRPYAKVI